MDLVLFLCSSMVSPSLMLCGLTVALASFYIFCVAFTFLSCCLACWMSGLSTAGLVLISGSLVRYFLAKSSSAGLLPAVGWAVALYMLRCLFSYSVGSL